MSWVIVVLALFGCGSQQDVTAAPAALSVAEAKEIPLCDQGDIEACYRLASCYQFGYGETTIDLQKARKWLEHACDANHGLGCNDLAVLHGTGAGVPRDEVKAAGLYDKACELKDGMACANLADFNLRGVGVAKDAVRAEALYLQACDLGDDKGCRDLAMGYVTGDALPHKPERGLELLTRGCSERKHGQSCADLGYLYTQGIDAPPDPARGKALIEQGCAMGYEYACGRK